MQETIKAIDPRRLSPVRYKEIQAALHKRWRDLHSDMHSAGQALDPEYVDHSIGSDPEVCLASSSPPPCSCVACSALQLRTLQHLAAARLEAVHQVHCTF